MTTPGTILLLMLATLVVGVTGMAVFSRGLAQRAEAARLSRADVDAAGLQRMRVGIERRLRRLPPFRALENRLLAAGIDVPLIDAVGLALGAALIGFGLATMVINRVVGVLVAAAVLLAGDRYVEFRRSRRVADFVAQLPELARTLSNASAAGLALTSAIALAARELSEPARSVLRGVADELALGQSIEGALHNLGRRMPSREVAVLVTTMVIQQRAGGDTVRALKDMSETLEARKDLRREVSTIMAGAVAVGWIVGLLGLGALLLINAVVPGAIERMLSGWGGRLIFAFGVSMFVLGFVLIRRITRIET